MLLNLGRWYLRWVLWLFFWENPQIIFEKLNQTLVAPFFLKKKKIWRYHYLTPVYQKSWWYDLQLLRYRVWQTGIGSYGSFFPFYHPKNQKKSELKKKWKNCRIYHHFTQVYQKHQSYQVRFLRYRVRQIISCHFGWFFAFFLPTTWKIKILNMCT